MGDRVIMLFSDILKKSFNLETDFIGHVGGDDFLVIQSNPDIDKNWETTKGIQADFAESALSCYSEEHRNMGYLIGRNRKGQWENFSLLSVAAAVLDIKFPLRATLESVNRSLSELKKEAKGDQNHFAQRELNQSCMDFATTSSNAFSCVKKPFNSSSPAVT